MGFGKALTVYLAHSRSSVSIFLAYNFEAISSISFQPACLLLPQASTLFQLALLSGLRMPVLPLVIPKLRAQPTGPKGGCGTVPHTLSHDVAGCPQCGAQGRVHCLLFARYRVYCLGWEDTPPSLQLILQGVEPPAHSANFSQACINVS